MVTHRTQLYFVFGLIVLMLVLGFLVAKPYLGYLVISGALAIVFRPVYKKLRSWIQSDGLASFVTVILILLLVLAPLAVLGALVFNQASDLYRAIFLGNPGTAIQNLATATQDFFNQLIPAPVGSFNAYQHIEGVLGWIINNLGKAFSGFLQGILGFLLSLFMLFYLLKDGEKLKEFLLEHSPLADKYDIQIANKIIKAVNSVIRGSLTIALIQGILAGIGFTVFGIPNAALWGAMASITALIPTVGTSLVLVPTVFYLLITHQGGSAIGLAIWGALAVGTIDNFLGPKLIGSRTHMHPLLVFIAVLGGVGFFGPIGILLGPLVFSVLFALLDIYWVLVKHSSEELHS